MANEENISEARFHFDCLVLRIGQEVEFEPQEMHLLMACCDYLRDDEAPLDDNVAEIVEQFAHKSVSSYSEAAKIMAAAFLKNVDELQSSTKH